MKNNSLFLMALDPSDRNHQCSKVRIVSLIGNEINRLENIISTLFFQNVSEQWRKNQLRDYRKVHTTQSRTDLEPF